MHTTLDLVLAFLCPEGAVLPRVTLASTRDAVHGTDVRELPREEWPLVAVRALTGRVGAHVVVTFDPECSPLPLPGREEMMVIVLRWKAPPVEVESRPAGEHHVVRASRKASSRFEQRIRDLQKSRKE